MASRSVVLIPARSRISHLDNDQIKTGSLAKQPMPHDHARHLCAYHEADQATVTQAIDGALAAKAEWESMPWNDRAAIFLKAADLVSGKYRYKLLAATILGQGKNAWQAEIDAAAEVRGILESRFNNGYIFDSYSWPTSSDLALNSWKIYTLNNPQKIVLVHGSASLYLLPTVPS